MASRPFLFVAFSDPLLIYAKKVSGEAIPALAAETAIPGSFLEGTGQQVKSRIVLGDLTNT